MRKYDSTTGLRSVWLKGLMIGVAGAAFGLASAAAEDSAADGAAGEEVVVTAQKRAQSVKDVPFSLSVFGARFFERTETATFQQLARYTPNLMIDDSVGDSYTAVRLRGLSSPPINQGIEPTVAMVVDGVYQARPQSLNTDLFDIERVEILRGPQGTLFGKNTTGGVINVITKGPTDTFEMNASGYAGTHNQRRLQGSVSGPAGDRFGYFASLYLNTRDSFLRRVVADQGEDRFRRYGGALKLRFDASPDLTFTLGLGYRETNSSQPNVSDLYIIGNPSLAGFANLLGKPLLIDDIFDRRTDQDFNSYNDLRAWSASLTVDYRINDAWKLKSLTGYQGFDDADRVDVDFTRLNGLDGGTEADQWQFSQEFQLNYKGESVDAVGGLFFFRQWLNTYGYNTVYPDFSALIAAGTGINIAPGTEDRTFSDTNTDSVALYGQATYHISERLRLTGGLRIDHEEKSIDRIQNGALYPILNPPLGPVSLDRSETNFSGMASLQYDITPEMTGYATVSRGVKSGGFNGLSTPNVASIEFKSEKALSFEAGLKGVFWDRRVRANLGFFHTTISDLQVTSFDGTQFLVNNAAKATSYGAEFDINARLTDTLNVGGAFGWNVATYDSYPGGSCAAGMAPTPPATTCTQDLSGASLPNAPRYSGSFYADYVTPLPGTSLQFGLRGDVTYVDHFQSQSDNDPKTVVPGYTLVNAKISLIGEDDRWELALTAQNLFDKRYLRQIQDQPLFARNYLAVAGDPRTYGLVLRVRY